MENTKVRLHTCDQVKEDNLKPEGLLAEKCRCRKLVTLKKAAELIEDGVARNIIISYQVVEVEDVCSVCGGQDGFKKRCRVCNNTGKVLKDKPVIETGEDIYMRPFLKTPRTATVEAKHFEYAYVKNDRDARKRIDLYHVLDQLALAKLGASLADAKTGEVLFEGTPEPLDDAKKGQGRTYDYGRSI